MASPLVSVIIPTYNRAKLITDTLHSTEVQTYTNWECLLVDDVSMDNTFEVIQEFVNKDGRFKYLTNKRKKCAQGARNTGLLESKGEFIQFLDSDVSE
jgi:glycosyltransferase involved in cell wall biosynthesis